MAEKTAAKTGANCSLKSRYNSTGIPSKPGEVPDGAREIALNT